MKKEKVLVCIIAQARTSKFSWKSFKNNVLNHLDADLALCVSEDEEIEKNNPLLSITLSSQVDLDFH